MHATTDLLQCTACGHIINENLPHIQDEQLINRTSQLT
jgi:hypothetical protein